MVIYIPVYRIQKKPELVLGTRADRTIRGTKFYSQNSMHMWNIKFYICNDLDNILRLKS